MRLTQSVPRVFGVLTVAAACVAQELPSPRDVDLTAPDGTKLKATYYSAGAPGPGVLLLHQCGSQDGETRHNWDLLAPRLAAAGIHVLTFDYRGHGESGGTRDDKLTYAERDRLVAQSWPGDVETAYAYLQAQPGVKRDSMGLGGSSSGCNMAIRTASHHREIKTLVLLSDVTIYRQEWQYLKNASQMPILFAGTDDADVGEILEWHYQLSPNPGTKLLHYPTVGHGKDMFKSHSELVPTIVEWYLQTLVRTLGSAPTTGKAKPSPPRILEIIDSPGGAQKVSEQLAEARKKNPKANLFSPVLVRYMGWGRMHEGDYKGATEIFKLSVQAAPESPIMYDSLAEAYLADGQNDLARATVKKELEVLSTDTLDSEELPRAIRESAEELLKHLSDKSEPSW